MKDILTLGIETSCDETSASVVKNGREILSNIIDTQIPIHEKYGGVVPEIASRNHIEAITRVTKKALEEANITFNDIDVIAPTYGPGLVGALLVGLSYGKALSYALNKPLVGVNHIEGHIAANYITYKELKPPFICVMMSGGNTQIVHVKSYTKFEVLGKTRDDAIGEAFDKVARVVGLGYPGGPKIDKAARSGNPDAISFPRARIAGSDYDFSFSGLKSAVLNYINSEKMKGHELNKADIAASFQHSVIEVLTHKAFEAVAEAGRDTLVLAGGVAANSGLEARLREEAGKRGVKFSYPSRILCTDNAAMIACRGYYQAQAGLFSDHYLNAVPGLTLTDK